MSLTTRTVVEENVGANSNFENSNVFPVWIVSVRGEITFNYVFKRLGARNLIAAFCYSMVDQENVLGRGAGEYAENFRCEMNIFPSHEERKAFVHACTEAFSQKPKKTWRTRIITSLPSRMEVRNWILELVNEEIDEDSLICKNLILSHRDPAVIVDFQGQIVHCRREDIDNIQEKAREIENTTGKVLLIMNNEEDLGELLRVVSGDHLIRIEVLLEH